eukprot:TRINITY_DN5246_c1_g1_i1.p1 TRINITY_DN5246_c1_g1~~TRINITY_DN5246_c1_g1_i1.p1  ORF type:complete len:145 (+),score=21.12 TRINITY_DN5246_c1_g1_i1:27-437(+)
MDFESIESHIKNNDFDSFVSSFDPNNAFIRNVNGFNLLHVASEFGGRDTRIVERLLQYIDPKLACQNTTPLDFASQNDHEKVVEVLISNPKVDPNIADVDGWTPLDVASQHGHQRIVEIILGSQTRRLSRRRRTLY